MTSKGAFMKSVYIGILAIALALPCLGQSPGKVIAFTMEPFVSDSGGKATGYAVDLFNAIVKAGNLGLSATELVPIVRFNSMIDQGGAIAVAVGRTPEREPKYQWISEIYTESFSFATRVGDPVINSFDEAKGAGSILSIKTGAPDTVLRANGITNIDNSATSNAAGLQMLLSGRGKAWFSGTAAIKNLISVNNAGAKVVVGKSMKPVGVWIAASKDVSQDTIKKIQSAFKAIKDNGEYDKIFSPLK